MIGNVILYENNVVFRVVIIVNIYWVKVCKFDLRNVFVNLFYGGLIILRIFLLIK